MNKIIFWNVTHTVYYLLLWKKIFRKEILNLMRKGRTFKVKKQNIHLQFERTKA